jgi:hypothetical protein
VRTPTDGLPARLAGTFLNLRGVRHDQLESLSLNKFHTSFQETPVASIAT